MKTQHTAGKWQALGTTDNIEVVVENESNYTRVALVRCYDHHIPDYGQAEANARLIAAAPELLQMVYDLKKCINRLSADNVPQIERDREAEWEGEAHELLLKINPSYYSNANEKSQ